MSWLRRKLPPEPTELLEESQVARDDADNVIEELRAQVALLRSVTTRLELVAERTMGELGGE